ncbi:MAG: alpha-L-fucosidase, partial [Clostridia bacterium]|nr:alpha-L-fucosidase [Clostridia bacterium]
PFFYHTLLDWWQKDYNNDFPKYIDYLIKSVEILCTNYGKIGGLWFDGFWDKPNADWQFDRLYATIRKHQPGAMIINNTGLSALGKVSHP